MEMESKSKIDILHIPEKILFKIMELAGCCTIANHSIRYVCKYFYEVYCKSTSCRMTFVSNTIRDDVFDAMMHSLRRPSRLNIESHEQCSEDSKLNKIVKRFGVHVRKLEFSQDHKNIRLADFEFIMRSMINVEKVTFNALNIYGTSKKLTKNPIELPRLKKLILIDCDEESADIMLCVKASLLEEFYVKVHSEDVLDFTRFFKNNKTIKHVGISGKLQNPKAFEQLRLSKLKVYNDDNFSSIRGIIACQPTLKYLNLLPAQDDPCDGWFDEEDEVKMRVNDEVFTMICNLVELETLKIVIGQVTPNAIGKIASLRNLKELVLTAIGEDAEFDNEESYDANKMIDVHFQKCFQKLIATPLPKLESFTWSVVECIVFHVNFSSDDEDLMENVPQREYPNHPNLRNVYNLATMAPNFPQLKYLKVDMKSNDENCISVRDSLKQFPYLETINLGTSTTFKGEPISIHENIKHVKINGIEQDYLIEMLRAMPYLESLEIKKTQFSLDKSFLQNLQATIPDSLKRLTLNFNSPRRQDFAVENVAVLQNIVKKLQKGKVKLTGNCSFDSLAEKIDRSVGVSLPRSPKWYIPGDDYGYEDYMELWK